jgi:DTW domain-containing protein YfiP
VTRCCAKRAVPLDCIIVDMDPATVLDPELAQPRASTHDDLGDGGFPREYEWNDRRVREHADGRIMELIALPDGSWVEGRALALRSRLKAFPPAADEPTH